MGLPSSHSPLLYAVIEPEQAPRHSPLPDTGIDLELPASHSPLPDARVNPEQDSRHSPLPDAEELEQPPHHSPLPDAGIDLELPSSHSPLPDAEIDPEQPPHHSHLSGTEVDQEQPHHSPLPGAGIDPELPAPHSPQTSSDQLPFRQVEDLQDHSHHSAALVENPESSLGVLTQFHQDFPVDGTLSSLTDSAHDSIPPVQSQLHDSDISATISDAASVSGTLASQAAQVVSILGSHSAAIRTQTQDDCDEEEEVVPDTVQKPWEPIQSRCELGAALCPPLGNSDNIGSISRPVPALGEEDDILTSCESPPPPPSLSSTFPNATMDPPRRSALEDLLQIRDSVMNSTPSIGLMVSEPAVVSPSKSDAHASLALSSLPFGNTMPSQPSMDLDYQQFPVTVAPSDLTTSPYKHSFVDFTEPDDNHGILGGILDENEDEEEAMAMSDGLEDDKSQNVFTVTLPLGSATRDMYLRVLAEHKQTIIEFNSAFSSAPRIPDADLVASMDTVFRKLRNLCDLPPYSGDLHSLPRDDIVKYATSTNSKFVFTHELLQALRGSSGIRVLIISQPGRVFEYLEAVVAASTANYMVLGRDGSTEHNGDDANPTVILADTECNLAEIHTEVEVVVKFDVAARSVKVPPSLDYVEGLPMTLVLVSMHTLEHIDLELGDELQGLERKNALNVVTVLTKELLRSPQDDYPEPHQAADLFAAFLKNPDNDIDWSPQPIPEKYLEIWAGSQSNQLESTQGSKAPRSESLAAGRKRSHVSSS